ncbi:hypothetical protein AVEN_63232-1 [Araneus ventricosus]|uniref:Uncharacterized protein n=1 Tax=Araneus ventricosus TaxID=182803 RepID=A0A4Y2B367_ARAVE|nr:hypothetical protein AVEN_63232-1 [Araneus ventricosus]
MQLNGLTVIGCDGTNVNTGNKGGIIRLMELDLNRPLQWCICLLQANELPLRHLLNILDGATSGHTEFCRPIRKAIKTCEELPVAPFSSISVENMPHNIDRIVLRNDQQYPYDICLAISRVECYSDMALRKPGSVAHSRWQTTADFKAKDYFALINWQRVGRFEPPLLMNVPFKEIEAMVKVRKTVEWSKYPCHTQAVERCIRLVSEASESVYGEEKRHGFILNRIQSKSLINHYNTKKDYNL